MTALRTVVVISVVLATFLLAAAYQASHPAVARLGRAPPALASVGDDARSIVYALDGVRSRLERLKSAQQKGQGTAGAEKQQSAESIALASANRRARAVRRRIVRDYGQVRRDGVDTAYDPAETMFISISSFRDLQCAPTIFDAFEKAKVPQNVFFGAVQQHLPNDPSCVPTQYKLQCVPERWCPTDNIKTRTIDPAKAKGPTFGRYYGMLMFRNERYFMMIDSHNRWVTHWDQIVISMYKGLPTKRGVLAHYPEAWINPEDGGKETNAPLDNRPTTMYMCTAHWLPELGFVRMGGFIISRKAKFGKDMCRPQPYAGAGFVFALGQMVKEVPFDPHLHYVFNGEEIMYTVRMWTHGWDIFSPSENILYHYYYRSKANKFWGILPNGWEQQRQGAERRIQFLLQTFRQNTTVRHVPDDTKDPAVLVDLDKYGLGKARTLEAYYEYSGIDRVHYKLTKDFCRMYS